MKYLLPVFFLQVWLSDQAHAQAADEKTSAFKEYQLKNAFKGIRFGSAISYVDGEMRLMKEAFAEDRYTITNTSFLQFNDISFYSGQAYFTRAGEFYQAGLATKKIPGVIAAYNDMKAKLTELFGKSDAEQSDTPDLLAGWDGTSVSIYLTLDPDSKEKDKGVIILIVFNTKLSNKKNKDIPRVRDMNKKLPKI